MWRSVEELFGVLENGEQLDILFGAPEWSWPILGMVTRLDQELEFSMYLQDTDRFELWESTPPPSLWIERPNLPNPATQFDS